MAFSLATTVMPRFLSLVCLLLLPHLALARPAMTRPVLTDPHAVSNPAFVPAATRVVKLGTGMTITTQLVKSPSSMWVIGKLVYLTNETVVEVKPNEILVMSRPYGPPKLTRWSSEPPAQSVLLYHDASQKLSVVLNQTNSLMIYYENSMFDIRIQQEAEGGSNENPDRGAGFNFLSVRLSRTTAVLVDAALGALTSTLVVEENPSLSPPPVVAPPPSPGLRYHGKSLNFFQEVKLFFRNLKELICYGVSLLKSSKVDAYFSNLFELYRPRYSDGRAIF